MFLSTPTNICSTNFATIPTAVVATTRRFLKVWMSTKKPMLIRHKTLLVKLSLPHLISLTATSAKQLLIFAQLLHFWGSVSQAIDDMSDCSQPAGSACHTHSGGSLWLHTGECLLAHAAAAQARGRAVCKLQGRKKKRVTMAE